MKFYFHPKAEAELDNAVAYYEQQQTGLGLEFAEEVYASIARIRKYPAAWTALSNNSRRCLINRFPYGVIYQVKTRALRIIAVAHLNRRPGYWQHRTAKADKVERRK
ncbi:MAG: type II toxin-antitoxin system RelE/ParE family toxin [Nitrospirota bacterium]|nr:type II toxin-antitoxin system RelE/ParE family toxin [Nitrospirota bacterium]